MKKILFNTLLAAFALSVASSCDDDFNEDVATPQEWPQEEAVTLPGFSATVVSGVADLASGDSVKLFDSTVSSALPEGTFIDHYRLNLTPAEVTDAASTTVNASAGGKVASAELQHIIEMAWGKRPVERTLNATLYADLMKEGQASLLTCENLQVKVIPEAPFIDSAYWLIGGMNNWGNDGVPLNKFNHSDKDVYEDPVFTIMATVSDNCYFKVIPQRNVDEGNYWNNDYVLGCAEDGDTSLDGNLIVSPEKGPGAIQIEKAGMYSITLNMMDYTYAIKEIVPEYYIVGAMQSWNSAATGMTCMLYPQNKMVHSYTTAYEGDANLKLWLGSDFGNWDVAYGTTVDGDNAVSGSLTGTGAGAIVCPEKTTPEVSIYYTFTVDFSTMSYSWTKLQNQTPATYSTIGLIGNGGDWGNDVDFKEVTPHNWLLKEMELTGGEVKIRANDAWDMAWGELDITEQNYGVCSSAGGCGNLNVAAGKYNIFFNDITGEVVFKSVE